ncbi:MAG TPA: cobalamin-independent methionine synthase II family protein [Terriglobales bacterium]|nr:cobalamin-independent methionine synthase II family protein [Terriglobales bacterium]
MGDAGGILTTTLVGSYPQPEWLVDRELLRSRMPARVRARDLWRVPEALLEQAQDDATVLALRDMERAGVDVVTDGEVRRESYSNRFATALDGMDVENPGLVPGRTGRLTQVPRVAGPVRRREPVLVRDVRFARANTDRPLRVTVPGPFTMAQQCQDEHYGDERALALDLAVAVNAELKDLAAAGADVLQIDEPYLQARPERARRYALEAIERALDGVPGLTALHTCFGYAYVVRDRPDGYPFLDELADCAADQVSIESAQQRLDPAIVRRLGRKTVILGVLDLADESPVESPAEVAARIRAALDHVEPERLVLAPDCGMKYLPRAVAQGKLRALVAGRDLVRGALA